MAISNQPMKQANNAILHLPGDEWMSITGVKEVFTVYPTFRQNSNGKLIEHWITEHPYGLTIKDEQRGKEKHCTKIISNTRKTKKSGEE